MIITKFLSKPDILNIVPEFIEEIFGISRTLARKQIKPLLDTFIDNLICFIEYPYVDKYYRDTYYNFFSKKHKSYERNSVRISFFKNSLNCDKYYKYVNNEEIEKEFLGYITLRPTTFRIIGNSFINPNLLKDNNFVCCLSNKKVSINGRKLSLHGFPFCSQDNESITCSEAVIMNLFDYFSEKYSEYSTILPSQITRILSKHSFQRQLPTRGLPTENISYVLKKLGFGSLVYICGNDRNATDTFNTGEFKDLMYTYVESGFPIIATLSHEGSHHAVLVIGRKDINETISFGRLKRKSKQYSFSEAFNELLIMDDNYPPFKIVEYKNPIFHKSVAKFYNFISIIVPLYPKVHLDAFLFKKFLSIIINEFRSRKSTEHIELVPTKKDCIFRCYLASSKTYKDYIASSKDVSDEFKLIALSKSMPRFIWVGEIINGNKLGKTQQIKSIIVVDATETGLNGNLLFATNSKYLIIKSPDLLGVRSEDDFYDIYDFGIETFYTFANNLKGEHTSWLS